MPAYEHLQDLKKDKHLPNSEKIDVCLTCKFWDVEGSRDKALAPEEALCMHPEMKKFQLIVSGGSGCNVWAKQPGVSEEAEAYAMNGGR